MMHTRHLQPNENWPDTLFMGFEGPQLDRDWCWVVEEGDIIQAGLLACPMHGVVFLMRLAAAAGAPRMAIRTILSDALAESKDRGYIGYTTLTDPTTSEGRKLQRLVTHLGGLQWPRPNILSFGLFAQAGEKL